MKILEKTCTWCGDELSDGEGSSDIRILGNQGKYTQWIHKNCRVKKLQHRCEGYKGRQYLEGKHGVILSDGKDSEKLGIRDRVPEEYRFGASEIEWEDFLSKLNSRLKEEFNFEIGSLYVVGSLATGEAVPGSDLDVVLGVEEKELMIGPQKEDIFGFIRENSEEFITEIEYPLSSFDIVSVSEVKTAPFYAWESYYASIPRKYNPNPIYDPIKNKYYYDPSEARDDLLKN